MGSEGKEDEKSKIIRKPPQRRGLLVIILFCQNNSLWLPVRANTRISFV